jgi:predicted MPP superfamily phosphohydrolase
VFLWIAVSIVVLGALAIAYGVFVERRWYRVGRYRLDILPGGTSDLSVLHLSDLHMLRDDRRAARFIESLPNADLAIVTGDIVGEPEAVEFTVRALRAARGQLASWFVLGSNDLYVPRRLNWFRYFRSTVRHRRVTRRRGRAADLVRLLEEDGWVHLKNRKAEQTSDGLRMEIVGLDDPHIHRADLRVAGRTDPEAFGLAVVHSPDPAPELVSLGYDLVVAGHTHGGQVRLPLAGALVTNSSFPNRLASGLMRFGRSYVHVSPGMGTSKYAPFRFLCRPEATLLLLGASAQSRATV